MHKAFCQSVVGLKKSFDAEVGDVVAQVKATVRFKCGVTEAGIYHEKDVVILTPAEYETLTSGKNWLMPEASRQKILLAIDALKDSLTEESAEEGKGE